MPIYEYYCPENHTIYQFYAKTLAQGKTVPPCPDNPKFHLVKRVSTFAVAGGKPDSGTTSGARAAAAMGVIERELSHVDENDPRAMGRMMRRMSELSGQKFDGEIEEVVRKLEEGADPDELEEQWGGEAACHMPDPDESFGASSEVAPTPKEPRLRPRRRGPMLRDPKLYDYP